MSYSETTGGVTAKSSVCTPAAKNADSALLHQIHARLCAVEDRVRAQTGELNATADDILGGVPLTADAPADPLPDVLVVGGALGDVFSRLTMVEAQIEALGYATRRLTRANLA